MTTITPLPTPVPTRSDPANFSDRADDFLSALPLFATEANTVAGEVNTNALNASTSASTATTQAGIATTQAGIATTKAGEALASADLAEDWAIKTDAPVSGSDYSSKYYSLEAKALNEKYQGSRASDPTLDKEGNPISAGDWYINSSSGFIRVYNGASWVQGIASVAGVSSINGNSGVLASKDVVPALTSNAGKVLKVNSGATDVEWGIGVASGYQEFTSSGTWAKPAEATWVYVEAIGGGDGGDGGQARVAVGSANASLSALAGNGTPLVAAAKLIRASDLPSNVPVVVGAGGLGGSGQISSLNAGASPGVALRNREFGGVGGVSHFLSADFFNSTHSATEFVVAIGYPQAAGGVGTCSATNTSAGNGTYSAQAGDNGVRDNTTKAVVAGGTAATGTYTLGGTRTITAANGVNGPAYCGGAGGGSAACQGLPATLSDTFVTVRGGDGGSGGYGAPGGHGGNACTAAYTLSGTRINSWIVAQGGDGGDGGNGIIRVWWW